MGLKKWAQSAVAAPANVEKIKAAKKAKDAALKRLLVNEK